jgi:hypothetical protein
MSPLNSLWPLDGIKNFLLSNFSLELEMTVKCFIELNASLFLKLQQTHETILLRTTKYVEKRMKIQLKLILTVRWDSKAFVGDNPENRENL